MKILNELNDMFNEALDKADHRTFGDILQEKREERNLKLVDIVRITGLSESLVAKLEANKLDDIKISTMKRLAIAYNLSPEVFIQHLGCDFSANEVENKANEISSARRTLKKA